LKTENFLRRRRGRQLDEVERLAIEAALSEPRRLAARQTHVHRGVTVRESTLLLDGLMGRYMIDREGNRQLVALHLPGDFVDLHAFPLQHLDHDVVTLTEVSIATVEHSVLTSLTDALPHLTRMLWFSTLLDAAMHREWIFRLGRLDAAGRLAHFLCETALRLNAIDRSDGLRFELPLTQRDIAEACGLTNVHVSRVMRTLRTAGLFEVDGPRVTVLDRPAAWRVAQFNPQYLYLDDGDATP